MPSADNRVVSMTFDNKAFESRLADTIKSLDKLNNTIAKTGAESGMDKLAASTKKFDVSGISAGIEGVSKKFLALSTIGITVLSNIANRAVNAGIRIVKSLSLDQVISGFQEYETNMKSIQTILANTKADGTNLQQVNDALDELNSYADLTIYNFAEMTRNIGTFTAAGVDLDTSVGAIKGIANAAAISGSTSQQASTAMYQLSQALASGTLKLMDWNSVVNAGMGGEVMQTALFETGKALGTLNDVPIDQTFDEWKDAGNSFRESLQEGWITTDVLTNTLQGFTGEMSKAELAAAGYNERQIKYFQDLGKTGVEAATKVRTFTQLIDTAQEAVGSGWSQTFRILLGDFEEATELFTEISEAFGDFAAKSADTRNALLQDWKDLGGRTLLIDSLRNAFLNLSKVFRPIKKAFRDIFPPITAKRLYEMTEAFAEFTDRLKPSKDTVQDLRRIFRGFFAALEIGWEVIKQTASVFKTLFQEIVGASGGGFLDSLANIGDFFTDLNKKLVDGKGIKRFFKDIKKFVRDPLPYLEQLKDKVLEFFNSLKEDFSLDNIFENVELPEVAVAGFDRLEQRFESLKTLGRGLKRIWDGLSSAFGAIVGVLEEVWTHISTWFSELGQRIADAMEPGDFDAAVDVVNVGLLGGIAAALGKLVSGGLKLDFGDGLLDNIKDSFDQLTSTLSAMQAEIRANALLKIAGAIGILTASVLVLSLIDSAALTKSLTAMAVGFGQLVGAFAIINKLAVGPQSAASFSILATGMIAMSTAMLIMAGAVKILSSMSWGELAKGLTSVTVLLGVMVAASYGLSLIKGGLLKASVGLVAIALALGILAGVMKIFATMSWEEIGKGLGATAGALGLIAGAMHLMPKGLMAKSVGLLAIGAALALIAGSMKLMSTLSWEEIGKGLAGIGGSLALIVGAMQLMPAKMLIRTSVGVLAIATSMAIMAGAMHIIAALSWEEIAKGLVGIAGALIPLAIATNFMSGSITGALAMVIVAGGLHILVGVIKEIGNLSIAQLATGLIGLALALGVIGLAGVLLAPAIPAILGLGAALLLLGGGFALFGVGVAAVAKGFQILAKVGGAGAQALGAALVAVAKTIPEFLKAIGEGILELIQIFIDAAPVLIKGLTEIVAHILESIVELTPQFVETILTLIQAFLEVVTEAAPDVIAAGFQLLIDFLTGIRDNIGEITTLVVEIVTQFLDSLAEQVPTIIDSVYNLFVSIVTGVVSKLISVASDFLPIGRNMLKGLLSGARNFLPKVLNFFATLPGKALRALGALGDFLRQKGIQLLRGLFNGIKGGFPALLQWHRELPSKILQAIGNVLSTLLPKGRNLIKGLLDGITNFYRGSVKPWFKSLPSKLLAFFSNALTWLTAMGRRILTGLFNGIKTLWIDVKTWFTNLPGNILGFFSGALNWLMQVGRDIMNGLWEGMKEIWNQIVGWFESIVNAIPDFIKNPLGIFSPSRVMKKIGGNIMEGLYIGLDDGFDGTEKLIGGKSKMIRSAFEGAFKDINKDALNAVEGDWLFNPVIRPVVDTTEVKKGVKEVTKILPGGKPIVDVPDIAPDGDFNQLLLNPEFGAPANANGQVAYNMTIHAPEALSTADIHRQNKNLLAMSEKELLGT